MTKKNVSDFDAQRQAEKECSILKAIKAKLPEGWCVKNKRPIRKEISHIGHTDMQILWTAWVYKAENKKETFLAIFTGDNLKIVSQEDIKNKYVIRSVA